MIRTVTLVGGISRDSLNRRLLSLFATRGAGRFTFDAPDLGALPFFSQDIENSPPEAVADFRRRVESADALFVVTPEYNRSFPGVLKNALDWTSRPQSLGAGKPAALVGASPGAIGTFGAQQHVRLVLSFLDWRLLSQPEFYGQGPRLFDEQGNAVDESLPYVDRFLDTFAAWVERHASAR